MTVLETQGLAARHAARALAVAGTARKNAALEAAARTIEARQGEILAANAADLEAAMAAGLPPPCWTGWRWTRAASPALWRVCGRWPPSPIPSGR